MEVTLLSIFLIAIVIEGKRIDKKTAVRTSGKCMKAANVPPSYSARYSRFDFPDDKPTHDFLHCFWRTLGVWSPQHGFSEHEIVDQIDDHTYASDLIAVVRKCNRNFRNYPPPRRVHHSYTCILNSRPGGKLQEEIQKRIID